MKYAEDKSMIEKAHYLKDYNFIEKPQMQQNFIDSNEDILGIKLFEWDHILYD
jgi:hypothetical protein